MWTLITCLTTVLNWTTELNKSKRPVNSKAEARWLQPMANDVGEVEQKSQAWESYLKLMGFRNFYAKYIDFEDHFLILVVTFIFTILLDTFHPSSSSLSHYNMPHYSRTPTSSSSPVLKALQLFQATLPRAINIIARRQNLLQDGKGYVP